MRVRLECTYNSYLNLVNYKVTCFNFRFLSDFHEFLAFDLIKSKQSHSLIFDRCANIVKFKIEKFES